MGRKLSLLGFVAVCIAIATAATAAIDTLNLVQSPAGAITVKATAQFKGVALDVAAKPITKNITFKYYCLNATAGKITSTGKFTAGTLPGIYPDAVKVVATNSGATVEALADVEIIAGPLAKIVIRTEQMPSPPANYIFPVETTKNQQFTAACLDSCGNVLQESVEWTATTASGEIDSDGSFIAGMTPGKYTKAITAKVLVKPNPVKYMSATATILVTPHPIARVDLTTAGEILPSDIPAGSKKTVLAKAYDASDALVTGVSFNYSVTAKGIGTIGKTNGALIAATKAGNTGAVVAQPMFNNAAFGAITGRTDVTIVPTSPKNVVVKPSPTTLAGGQKCQFTAQVSDTYNNTIADPDPAVAWTCSPTAGNINQTGEFTANEVVGTFQVTATCGTASGKATVKLIGDSAEDHLRALINAPDDSNPKQELQWFTNYVKSVPADPVGQLGLSIAKIAAAAFDLTKKYGVANAHLAQAVSFQRAIRMVPNGEINKNRIAFDLASGQSILPTEQPAPRNTVLDTSAQAAVISPGQIATDIKTVVIPALQQAISSLAIPAASTEILLSYTDEENNEYHLRAEEVIAYRAALRAVVGVLSTVSAYSWNPGTFNWNRSIKQMDTNHDSLLKPSEYLPGGTFGKLTDRPLLNTAWTTLNSALDDATEVAQRMQASPDPDQLLSYAPADWSEVEASVELARTALTTPTVENWEYGPVYPSWFGGATEIVPVTVDYGSFWRSPIADLRTLFPTYSYQMEYGLAYAQVASVPNKTLGGILPNGATEIEDEMWADIWSDLFTDENESWFAWTEPYYGQDDVSPSTSIYVYVDYGIPNLTTKLTKYTPGGWVNVQLDLDFGYPQDSGWGMLWVYTPHQMPLDSGAVYQLTVTSSFGRVTSYFRTQE